MISAGFVSLTLFTDRTLLYWQSEAAASAAMGAGVLYWSIICLPLGMLGYISTFVSQYRGAKRESRIGSAYKHAMLMARMIVPVFILVIALAPMIFTLAGHRSDLVRLEATYLRVLMLGGIGVLFYSVQSGLLIGQGRTATVLTIDGVATALNLALDAVLIFGMGPIPPLGIVGAALATAISFWIKIPIANYVIRNDRQIRDDYHVGRDAAWEPSMLRRLVVFGAPAGLQMLAEAGCFSVVMLYVGGLGELPMAATTLALGLNVLAFVPMIGLGIGVSVLVGQHLTEERIDLARRTVFLAACVSLLYTTTFAAMLGLAPDVMVSIYAWGTEPERFARMRPLLVPLLRIIAVYCVVEGLQGVFVGAIKGAGDTWFVLIATFVVSVSAISTGICSQSILGPSLMLWWYVIAGWVTTMGIVFAARYFSGSWETKRVIENS